jgi:tetratricopeptide (TPR) repeat protein
MNKYYQTLGLKEGASQNEIHDAYERLSKELNPLENGNTDFFIEEYTKLQEAYNELSNSSILSSNIHKPKVETKNSQLDSISNSDLKVGNSLSKRKKYFGITFGILLLVTISTLLFYLYSPIVTNWYFEKGKEIYNNKNYSASIPYFNTAIERDNSNYIYFKYRAVSKSNLKDNRGAIKDFNRAILLNPKIDTLYAYRARTKVIIGDKTASNDFEKGIAVSSKSSIVFEIRGIIRKNKYDYENAINDFTNAIKIKPSTENYYYRGFCKSRDIDYKSEEIIKDYKFSLNSCKKPDCRWCELSYGECGLEKKRSGDKVGAVFYLTKAIKLNNRNHSYYLWRANAKYDLDDFRGALNDYYKVIKLINPQDDFKMNVYYSMGECYENIGDKNKACQYYSKAGEYGLDVFDKIKTYCN